MNTLQARAIGLAQNNRTILSDISFSIGSGAFLGIIGPNGAGKSTLLNILSSLRRPTSGSVTLDNRKLTEWPLRDLARHRAYLPQHPSCDWPIPVASLIALGLTPTLPAFGSLPAAQSILIDKALLDFDLLQQRQQAATTLSGGELSRAMLARAMIGSPRVLLVDEPFAGLDPRHAIAAATRLAAYAAAGNLVIAALHELNLALAHTTHLLALRNGQLLAYGPTTETLTPALIEALFDIPATLHRSGHGAWVQFLS